MTSSTGPALDLQTSEPSPRSRVHRRTQFHTQSTTPLEKTTPARSPAVAGKHMQLLARLRRAGARTAVVLPACGVMLLGSATAASAATTVKPGWECIPTTAGQAVVSGGNSTSGPSCASGTTAVLAPTYVASGIDGKPTVQFASVNVQIVDGSGSTSTVNGTGNLVLGYDEGANNQGGSHNLVLGEDQSDGSYAGVLGGDGNTVDEPYGAAVGTDNLVDGFDAFAAGTENSANGNDSSVTGGESNSANGDADSISGGESNTAASIASWVGGGQSNTAENSYSSISGGADNLAEEVFGTISGGCQNSVGDTSAPTDSNCGPNSPYVDTVAGGYNNRADGFFSLVAGGYDNEANGPVSFVAGGNTGDADGANSTLVGGWENSVATGDGTSMSQFGGQGRTLSSKTNNEIEVGGMADAP